MKPIRLLVLIASLTLTTSCGLLTHDAADQPQTSTISASSTAPPSALESPDNLEPLDQEGSSRLTPVSSSETSTAAGTIELLSVQGRGPKTGYQRDLFGEAWDDGATGVLWSGNGCRMMVIWMSRGAASANAQVEMRFEVDARVCHVSDEKPYFPDEPGPIMLGSAGPRVRPGPGLVVLHGQGQFGEDPKV